MSSVAAGLLMFRDTNVEREFFLVHPGGPFFVKKNEGSWSIPKGLPEPEESLLQTAQREFFEETAIRPTEPFYSLGAIQSKSRKTVHAWAFKGEWDPADGIVSNTFQLEWPPKSGKLTMFPEVDRAAWLNFETALTLINPSQIMFLKRAKAL